MIVKFIDKMNVELVDYGQGVEKLMQQYQYLSNNMFIVKIIKKPKTIDIWKVKKYDNR